MPSRSVRSEASERAQFDLRIVVGDHHRRSRALLPGKNRIITSEPNAEDRATQLTIALLVAITENYSSNALLGIPQVSQNDVRSWQNQEAAWLAKAGVNLEACPSYFAFRGWNEARNAIMHGMGALTEMQRTSRWAGDVLSRLSSARVLLRRNQLVLDHVDLGRCVKTCYDFIGELDDAATKAGVNP